MLYDYNFVNFKFYFQCETCDKEFKKSKLYKEHLLLEHKASRFW